VLDLLDLILGAELLELKGTRARIPPIDYLITLLCNAGTDRPPHDPVQLTPRLHELCERSGVDYDPRLPEIEAEFFHAADMYEADTRGEAQLRALTIRKTELGSSYFAPQILRAIVTYNIALLQRIDEEVLASQDWGSLPPVAAEPRPAVSVFDTATLPQIAQALRRRGRGEAPELNAIDRIAWCLDLDYPTASERRALLAEPADSSADLTATVILVGLLCRSSIVLEDEFPPIGMASTHLFGEWIPELSEALQQKVNQEISADDYREACRLSELKTRFLYTSMAEVRRKIRTLTPQRDTAKPANTARAAGTEGTAEATRTVEASRSAKTATTATAARTVGTAKNVGSAALESANPIIQEALTDVQAAPRGGERSSWKEWPTRRLAAVGVAIAGALLVIGMGGGSLWGGDHARFNRDQLDRVSPYLSYGARSGKGQGPAFVGEIRASWSALAEADRMLVATDLVESLRENGVRDVMIYDGDGLLRIQALGERPPRLLLDQLD
jgi:hypothetical protein